MIDYLPSLYTLAIVVFFGVLVFTFTKLSGSINQLTKLIAALNEKIDRMDSGK